ncbi:hypothetical protein ScPMuIL_012954 [Solemya velum]
MHIEIVKEEEEDPIGPIVIGIADASGGGTNDIKVDSKKNASTGEKAVEKPMGVFDEDDRRATGSSSSTADDELDNMHNEIVKEEEEYGGTNDIKVDSKKVRKLGKKPMGKFL